MIKMMTTTIDPCSNPHESIEILTPAHAIVDIHYTIHR